MAREDPPLVSVIIPVWNDAARLALCLDAVLDQSLPRERYEVIVVDNGSTDGSAEAARSFEGVTLLIEPEPGSYNARNRGLSVARGTYVAFTDSDCIPDRHWLENAVAVAESDLTIGVVAGRIELFDPECSRSSACADYERLFAFNQAANSQHDVCATANWLSPREIIVALGGFNKRLKSGGDFSLARLIAGSGKRISFASDAIVHHPVRSSIRDLVTKTRRTTGGRWSTETRPIRIFWVSSLGFLDWFRRSGRILIAEDILPHRKAGIWLVSTLVALTTQLEALRLTLGGRPLR